MEEFKLVNKEFKGCLISQPTEHKFIISADKIILREKEVEIINLPIEKFAEKFDKITFKSKDGKETVFLKEVKK